MDKQERFEFITTIENSFNMLSEKDKEFLAEQTKFITYQQGQIIHSGDSECLGMLFVKRGSLRVYMMSEEGKEVTLFRVFPGEISILTASCVLSEITFDVYVDAQEYSEVVVLNACAFSKLMLENIYMENLANKLKAQRFSDVMWTMQQILFYSFDKRLAIFLYEEMIKNGNIINYSHQEIAKYLGSAREVVSRMLKYFENEEIVKVSRKEIEIINKKKLMEYL